MKYLLPFILGLVCFPGLVFAQHEQEFKQLVTKHVKALKAGQDDLPEFQKGLKKLADENNRESQFFYAMLTMKDSKRMDENIELLRHAQANGCNGATGFLGLLYIEGDKDLPKNTKKGLRLMQLAARRGDFGSQIMLGKYYRDGSNGLSKDLVKAYSYLYQATQIDKQGAKLFQIRFQWLEPLKKQLTQAQIKTAEDQALKREIAQGGSQTYFCAQSIPM